MSEFDVFFYEAFDAEAQALREALPSSVRAGFTPDTLQGTGAGAPPSGLVSIRTQSVVPRAWHAALGGLLARTTGFDHLAGIAREPGPRPALACLPEYCSRAVAEQAALLWLALLRRLPAQARQWPTFLREGLTGRECAGATLVVVGVGRIGHEVAQVARGLGMRVYGVDVARRHTDVEYLDWTDAAPRADVIVACMDLTRENRRYFNRTTLAAVKRSCVFVNVARGELASTPDLVLLLKEGVLGGVGLDVYEDEPRVADALRGLAGAASPELDHLRELARLDNVLLTPHNAFNTAEAVRRKADLSAEQVVHFLRHGTFRWPLPSGPDVGRKTV